MTRVIAARGDALPSKWVVRGVGGFPVHGDVFVHETRTDRPSVPAVFHLGPVRTRVTGPRDELTPAGANSVEGTRPGSGICRCIPARDLLASRPV